MKRETDRCVDRGVRRGVTAGEAKKVTGGDRESDREIKGGNSGDV